MANTRTSPLDSLPQIEPSLDSTSSDLPFWFREEYCGLDLEHIGVLQEVNHHHPPEVDLDLLGEEMEPCLCRPETPAPPSVVAFRSTPAYEQYGATQHAHFVADLERQQRVAAVFDHSVKAALREPGAPPPTGFRASSTNQRVDTATLLEQLRLQGSRQRHASRERRTIIDDARRMKNSASSYQAPQLPRPATTEFAGVAELQAPGGRPAARSAQSAENESDLASESFAPEMPPPPPRRRTGSRHNPQVVEDDDAEPPLKRRRTYPQDTGVLQERPPTAGGPHQPSGRRGYGMLGGLPGGSRATSKTVDGYRQHESSGYMGMAGLMPVYAPQPAIVPDPILFMGMAANPYAYESTFGAQPAQSDGFNHLPQHFGSMAPSQYGSMMPNGVPDMGKAPSPPPQENDVHRQPARFIRGGQVVEPPKTNHGQGRRTDLRDKREL